jgi:aminoglycoside phosphotransferase (APT) family kinase protein
VADSPTKVPVTDAELAAMVRRGFGAQARITGCVELTDGTYNAVYRIRLADGAPGDASRGGVALSTAAPGEVELVLKVAPPVELDHLSHEVHLMRTEVDFYRRAAPAGVPVPGVAYADLGRDLIPRDYAFLDLLPGQALKDVKADLSTVDLATIHRELGAAVARLHTLTGDRFGYPLRASATWQPTWRAAFLAMVDDLLADAARLAVDLPLPVPEIRARLHRHGPLLDAVDRPALVHFDLWDGNVFVRPTAAGWRLAGLIDGERALYGDPCATGTPRRAANRSSSPRKSGCG